MIINPDVIGNKFECGLQLSNYLQRNGFPLLGMDATNGIYYFADTEALEEFLGKVPWWRKVLDRVNKGFEF